MIDFDNFILEPAEANQIYTFILSKSQPVPLRELAELVIRRRLETLASANNRKIYSPEQKYSRGEKIFFYFHYDNKFIPAEIISIESPHKHYQYGHYQKMTVSIQGFEKEKKYIFNCPDFPLRFGPSEGKFERHDETNQATTPGQIFTKYEEKIAPSMKESLSHQDELINVNDEWFMEDKLLRIRPDEVQSCHKYIKENGAPVSSYILVSKVFKCSPDSTKFELFRFSLDHYLESEKKFIKNQKFEGISWDIKKPVPPKQIKQTLSLDAISNGFLKISESVAELLEYCNASDEITLKTYGEYEINCYIDHLLNRIYGQQIKQWFLENNLKPKDVIYIKSPISPNDLPILYTAFEYGPSEPKHGEKKKDHIRGADIRHRLYSLLNSCGQYLHVKEIKQQIENSLSQTMVMSTIEGILSMNNHIFSRLAGIKGLWGLVEWQHKKAIIDSTSLSLAINDEDWVIRILEQEQKPLSVAELAERLSSIFITPKEKILEITFLDPNDQRLIQLNGKWGLKLWVENWKKRIEIIDKYLLEYRKLSDTFSNLQDYENRLESKIDEFQDRKESILQRLSKLNELRSIAAKKICDYKEKHHKLLEQINSLKTQISIGNKRKTLPLILILMPLTLATAGALVSKFFNNQIIAIISVFLAILLFSYLASRQIRRKAYFKGIQIKKNTTEDTINKITTYLSNTEKKSQIAKEKYASNLASLELITTNIQTISNKLSETKKKIEDLSQKIERYDLQAIGAEKEKLTGLINRYGL